MPNYQFVPINDLRPGDEIASNNGAEVMRVIEVTPGGEYCTVRGCLYHKGQFDEESVVEYRRVDGEPFLLLHRPSGAPGLKSTEKPITHVVLKDFCDFLRELRGFGFSAKIQNIHEWCTHTPTYISITDEELARGFERAEEREKYDRLKTTGVLRPNDLDWLFFGLAVEGHIAPGEYLVHFIK